MKIGFIGCGNMASAIIKGIISAEEIDSKDILVFDTYSPACETAKNYFGVTVLNSECEVAEKADIVFLAVKPNVISAVSKKIADAVMEKQPLVVSIAAGKP